jgi:hypothetical protein
MVFYEISELSSKSKLLKIWGFDGSEYDYYRFLGCEAVWLGNQLQDFASQK